MRSDLTCPIEVVDVRVEHEVRQEGAQGVVCVIGFLNLTEKTLDSVQMNIICFDAEDARLGGRLVRASVREDGGEKRFSGAFMPEHVDGVVRVEASVEKVWFKDGVVWRREERNVREYTPNNLPEGRELDRLRAVAGPDAMGYPYEEELLWLCVCGRANGIDDKVCFKCHREREQVMRTYSYAAIESTVGRRERDLEKRTMDNLRRSSEQTARRMTAEQEKRRRRARRAGVAITLLALVAICLAAWRWGVPYAATYIAKGKLDEGLAADAKAIYEWTDTHWPGEFGAREGAQEAEVRIVEGLIAAGNEETLIEASWRAQAIPKPTGTELYERAQFALAELAEESGDIDRAEAIYRAMPESEEAGRRLLALIYSAGEAAQEKVDYPTAIERFNSLGDYEDAQERKTECIYLYGRQLMREGHYAQAAEQFLLVADEGDALELARESYYLLAHRQREQGEYVQAAANYESLGVYKEAEERARACRYAAGIAALEADELETAAEQLALAGEHEDAAERYEEAVYTLSGNALDAGDPETAVIWLEKLARSDDQVAALNVATYALAEKREAEGDREGAAIAYASLGDYEDAMERAQALEYAIAVDEMDVAPDSALSRFEGLGDYADAAERAARCRYLLADEAYASGDYPQAVSRFEELGDYADSASRLRRSRYALAQEKREAGDSEEAAALYEACGAYLDAEEMAQRSRYDAAAALEEAGELSAAAQAFHALGSYEDAPERARAAEDAWLGGAYADATMDMELGNYEGVIAALGDLWQEELPERYADIPALYVQACLDRADELIASDRPLDALPILERIAQEDGAKSRLSAYVFAIIGTWETSGGERYVFRRDGTCSLDGEEAYFSGKDYDIYIGQSAYPTARGYHVVRLSRGTLTLRDAQTDRQIRMNYVGEPLDLIDMAPDEEPGEEPEREAQADAGDADAAQGAAEGETEEPTQTPGGEDADGAQALQDGEADGQADETEAADGGETADSPEASDEPEKE